MKVTPASVEITKDDYDALGKGVSAAFKMFTANRIERNPTNKVGVIISLNTEDPSDRGRLENDLVAELREYIARSGLSDKFNIISLKPDVSAKIDNLSKADAVLRSSRSHLIVYGMIAKRSFNNEPSYVCRLRGIVRHVPITGEVKKRLGEDFDRSLPGRVVFPQGQEVLGFDLTREFLSLTTKFITACAALASSDYDFSYKLLTELWSELETMPADKREYDPVLSEIYKRTKLRLSEAAHKNLEVIYARYQQEEDENILLESEEYLETLRKLDYDSYSTRQMAAMVLYLRGLLPDAIAQLEGIVGAPDTIWRYNLGFLYAKTGRVDDALEQYRKATQVALHPYTARDLDVFLSREIDRSKTDPTPLRYLRAVLNYKAREDYVLAKKDFELVLSSPSIEEYPEIKRLSLKFMEGIKSAGH